MNKVKNESLANQIELVIPKAGDKIDIECKDGSLKHLWLTSKMVESMILEIESSYSKNGQVVIWTDIEGNRLNQN